MKNFIAYHKVSDFGEYDTNSNEFEHYSGKSEKQLTKCINQRIWVISGRKLANGTKYELVSFYTASYIDKLEEGGFYIGGEGQGVSPPIDLTNTLWLHLLVKEQNNFSYGLNEIKDSKIIDGLNELIEDNFSVENLLMPKLSINQYQDVIKNNLSAKQIETLQILYYLPNSSATAKELANALNYSGFQAANRQIGQIGKSILSNLNKIESEYFIEFGYYLLIGLYQRPAGWVMWDNLKKALENLNIVTNDNEKLEIFERLPTESFQFEETELFKEGKVIQVFINRYERNQEARTKCIKYHGDSCTICGFNFGAVYGDFANGHIHVHHKVELSEIKKEYKVDPIKDIIPVCANCHSALHLSKPAMTVEQLKKILENKIKS